MIRSLLYVLSGLALTYMGHNCHQAAIQHRDGLMAYLCILFYVAAVWYGLGGSVMQMRAWMQERTVLRFRQHASGRCLTVNLNA